MYKISCEGESEAVYSRIKSTCMSTTSLTYSVEKTNLSTLSQVDWNNLPFGKIFSDHMFIMEYADGEWKEGKIVPFQPIPMHPAMSALHYGQSIFEGLKAYKDKDGEVILFRPDMNAKRFAESAARMCMPEVPEDIFIEAVKQLVAVDKDG